MTTSTAPERTEAAEYYFTYIHQVGAGDIRQILGDQTGEALATLQGISEEKSLHRYGPDKWSIRQVLSHLNDAERMFVLRAFWFARGLEGALPSFIRTSRLPQPERRRAHGPATSRSFGPSAPRPCLSSKAWGPTIGTGAASPAVIRSRSVRWPTSQPDTSRTICGF